MQHALKVKLVNSGSSSSKGEGGGGRKGNSKGHHVEPLPTEPPIPLSPADKEVIAGYVNVMAMVKEQSLHNISQRVSSGIYGHMSNRG